MPCPRILRATGGIEIDGEKRDRIRADNRTFRARFSEDTIEARIEQLELPRVRSSSFKLENILEHATRYMETLQSAGKTDLEDDAVTIVRHRCPNERMATHKAPVKLFLLDR